MDSITQAALGAAVAGMVAGKKCTPKVLAAGALLGTLPDLDVLLDYGDPISNMVNHRGFSHSLIFLLPFSYLLSFFCKRFIASSWPFWQLFTLICAALITHPLLDSFTSYGTQLFWPIKMQPIAISSVFIVDPIYTLPLLIMVIIALFSKNNAARYCSSGLILSSLYLIWSLIGIHIIKERVSDNLLAQSISPSAVFIAPTAFNTLLWRVLVLDKNNNIYREGLTSLFDDNDDIHWQIMDKGQWPLDNESAWVKELDYFTGGFVRFSQDKDTLIATDLRLGLGKYHTFNFIVAKKNKDQQWDIIEPLRTKSSRPSPDQLALLWSRLLGDKSIDTRLCKTMC